MALTFPTIAEQVVSAYESTTKTTSLVVVAKKFGGERSIQPDGTLRYIFDDDTSLVISGRGKGHKYEIWLP